MSRVIKFRVWEPTIGKMFFSSKCPFGSSWITEDGVSIAHGIDMLSVEILGRAGPEHTLSLGWQDRVERFTSLLDLDGREIYEGDIVGNEYMNPRLVQFGPFEDSDGYEVIGWHTGQGWLESNPSIRVLGNIHQNPELLNP